MDVFCVIGVFLQFSDHHICIVMTGTRVNQDAQFSLEIPLDYFFYGDSRVKTWLTKTLEKVDNSLNIKGKKVVKYKHLKFE